MKRLKKSRNILPLLLAAALLLSLAACSSESPSTSESTAATASENSSSSAVQPDESSSPEESTGSAPAGDGPNILIAYFTVPLNEAPDDVDGIAMASRKASDDGTVGNVRFMANVIQEHVGGDLFQIETVQEYPVDTIDSLLEFAYEEKAENARPELSAHIENLDDYDVIFIGYPNWNADLPMPLYTFFEEYDFSGKTLIPFVAHGGSGASRTVETIAEVGPGATVVDDPVTVFWDEFDNAEAIVTEWVENLGY